jgi:hypothetical protein
MPLARYFLVIGGVLLVLLFVVDAVLPSLPVADKTDAAVDMPVIRINSDRKWPERVVFDTSTSAFTAVPTLKAEAAVPASTAPTVADTSAKRVCGTHMRSYNRPIQNQLNYPMQERRNPSCKENVRLQKAA